MFLPNLTFHSSYTSVKECPTSREVRVVAFTGRSNSGKSSLISALANHKNLARVSAQPGKTRLINYFRLGGADFSDKEFYLADLPGYGFARIAEKEKNTLREMIDSYLANCQGLVLLVLVLDARRSLGKEEENILAYCKATGLPLIFVRSKWDKLNQKERQKCKKDWKAHGLAGISYPVSSTKKTGIPEVTQKLMDFCNNTCKTQKGKYKKESKGNGSKR